MNKSAEQKAVEKAREQHNAVDFNNDSRSRLCKNSVYTKEFYEKALSLKDARIKNLEEVVETYEINNAYPEFERDEHLEKIKELEKSNDDLCEHIKGKDIIIRETDKRIKELEKKLSSKDCANCKFVYAKLEKENASLKEVIRKTGVT